MKKTLIQNSFIAAAMVAASQFAVAGPDHSRYIGATASSDYNKREISQQRNLVHVNKYHPRSTIHKDYRGLGRGMLATLDDGDRQPQQRMRRPGSAQTKLRPGIS